MGRLNDSISLPVACKTQRRTPLEVELESELHQARVVHGAVYHAETGLRTYVLFTGTADPGHPILRVVEQIEKLGPELQSRSLAEGQRKVLE